MRLLAHNMLRNTAKGVEEGYPLRIEASKVEVRGVGIMMGLMMIEMM